MAMINDEKSMLKSENYTIMVQIQWRCEVDTEHRAFMVRVNAPCDFDLAQIK
jgi:hypothetical protein